MHPITQSLQSIYNTHAKHFSQTRKKHRPEMDHIIEYINTLPQKTLTIIELWCGDGRLYQYLTTQTKKTIKYTGVDIADKLLDIGKKAYSDAHFVHTDMLDFIQKGKQESVDIIVSVAAFHHLTTRKDRLIVLKNIYRLLKYDGSYIMTNRALSQRFAKKYWKSLYTSITKRIISIGQKDRRDVYIPWSRQWDRYYHIFSKKQIENLSKQSGFTMKQNCYILANGTLSQEQKNARNIFTITQKSIKK
jgi:ubiquinone/menaquinone biosynthesis C-methylase UbiE